MNNDLDRKIDVAAMQFLLVQNRHQTYGWTLIGSGANGSGILECHFNLTLDQPSRCGFKLFSLRTRRNIEPYSPLKPTKLSFVFIGPNSLSRAEDLPAVNHVTQSVVRVGSKIIDWVVFKELRLEPKFLNRGLWIWIWRANYEPKPAKNLIFPPKHESQMWSLKLYNK